MIRRIAERGTEGIFHCCGGDAVSRGELALRACQVFDLDPALRFGRPDRAAVPAEPVPHDTSLDATVTAQRLGVTPPGVTDLLTRFRDEWATAQPGGIR